MKTIAKTKELRKKTLQVMLSAFLLGTLSVSAQITETIGSVVATTSIATHEINNGFDNDALTFSGTGDVRITTPSTGYTGASGGANVLLNTGQNFIISNLGTNTCIGTTITVSFGVFKSTNAENGSNFRVEYSIDGGLNWLGLPFAALPTGSGTSRWYLRSVSGLPSTCNLKIRFRNAASSSSPNFRVDDISSTCGSAVESLCEATITANDTNVFCSGDSVRLTANQGDSYAWSNGDTTQSILVLHSGTYFVTVERSCCFATSSGFYVLVHNDGNTNPVVGVAVDTDTVCVGDSVTLTARTFARDLFFSQYQEGSNLDKAIEIYNGTGQAVLLSNYQIRNFHNGACDNVSPTFTIALPAVSLADGDVYVIANPSHSNLIGVAADYTAPGLQFNGDDAVTLFSVSNNQYVDIIGSICHDPGSAWTAPNSYRTQDRTLSRKPCIY
ncbi:MAG: lamin tail domain-containing protein, partial [Bacteroidia bacterium]